MQVTTSIYCDIDNIEVRANCWAIALQLAPIYLWSFDFDFKCGLTKPSLDTFTIHIHLPSGCIDLVVLIPAKRKINEWKDS